MSDRDHHEDDAGSVHDGLVRAARLAHLDLDRGDLESLCDDAERILGHIARMGRLDLEGVEPLVHPHDDVGTLGGDEPVAALGTDDLMRMAPASHPPYVRVPKVIDGGGA